MGKYFPAIAGNVPSYCTEYYQACKYFYHSVTENCIISNNSCLSGEGHDIFQECIEPDPQQDRYNNWKVYNCKLLLL